MQSAGGTRMCSNSVVVGMDTSCCLIRKRSSGMEEEAVEPIVSTSDANVGVTIV